MITQSHDIIGIDTETLDVFTGYDEREERYKPSADCPEFSDPYCWTPATREEKIALADRMIALWTRYKEQAQ